MRNSILETTHLSHSWLYIGNLLALRGATNFLLCGILKLFWEIVKGISIEMTIGERRGILRIGGDFLVKFFIGVLME